MTDVDGLLQGLPERKPDIAPDVEAMAKRGDVYPAMYDDPNFPDEAAAMLRALAAENARLMGELELAQYGAVSWREQLARESAAADMIAKERDAFQAALATARSDNDALLNLLYRIAGWDMMDSSADGKYWRQEIARAIDAAHNSQRTTDKS